MTKKDFEAAARLLQRNRLRNLNTINDTPIRLEEVCTEIEDFLCEFFVNDNPRFDSGRFRKACQP